jgi:hypothetical protein
MKLPLLTLFVRTIQLEVIIRFARFFDDRVIANTDDR